MHLLLSTFVRRAVHAGNYKDVVHETLRWAVYLVVVIFVVVPAGPKQIVINALSERFAVQNHGRFRMHNLAMRPAFFDLHISGSQIVVAHNRELFHFRVTVVGFHWLH